MVLSTLQAWIDHQLVQEFMAMVSWLVIAVYYAALSTLAVFGLYRLSLWRSMRGSSTDAPCDRSATADATPSDEGLPEVVVQLPVYNERYVAERVVDAACALDYPRDRLHIQVLDDSTDDTCARLAEVVNRWRARGVRVDHLRRSQRIGFKAGALADGLQKSDADLVAIFDADFVPDADFLRRALVHFANPQVGMVQARWDYLNRDQSFLTRAQAVLLDAHFLVEQPGRAAANLWFNFNGTAGVWRRSAIESVGGWAHDTLTEDLDLSYRAQLAGWKFVYCSDLGVASELPTLMSALKSQQVRWATGGAQTLRKLLGLVLGRDRLRQRAHGLMHLVSPLGHLCLLAISLLYLPSLMIRQRLDFGGLLWLDQFLLLAGTGSFTWVFIDAVRRRQVATIRRIADLVGAMALGLGFAAANSRAVVAGLWSLGGVFHRTPKYADNPSPEVATDNNQTAPRLPRYRAANDHTWFYEAGLALYCSFALGVAVWMHWWSSIPFLGLFAGGYATVFIQTFETRLPPRQLPTSSYPATEYVLE